MNLNRRIRIFLIGLASLLALVPATAAFADGPQIQTFKEVYTDNVLVNCGDFSIIENAVTTVRVTTFFDDQGNSVRRIIHFTYSGTYTNSVTGKILTDTPDPQTYIRDYVNGTTAGHGLVFRITVPGEGIVLLDAGTVIFNADGTVTAYGRHDGGYSFEANLAALCQLMR
jgi:metal-dependent HD superfamily phosphatase/phosphodiesterase